MTTFMFSRMRVGNTATPQSVFEPNDVSIVGDDQCRWRDTMKSRVGSDKAANVAFNESTTIWLYVTLVASS